MDLKLRITILVIGVAIIALIYLWGMRKRIKERIAERRRRRDRLQNEPVIAAGDHHGGDEPFAGDEPFVAAAATGAALPATEPVTQQTTEYDQSLVTETRQSDDDKDDKVNVVLLVLAPAGQTFHGGELQTAFQELELVLNDKGTWDCYLDAAGGEKPVFGIGHLKEPGHFKREEMATLRTPGLVLFMTLPGPLDASTAVDLLVTMAERLARKLGGSVCDERGNTMTAQLVAHLRSEAAEFDRQTRS